MASFYGWGSSASRLQSHDEETLSDEKRFYVNDSLKNTFFRVVKIMNILFCTLGGGGRGELGGIFTVSGKKYPQIPFINTSLPALTHETPKLPSYRNQSIDLLCKSTDWFLFDGNFGV